MTNRRKTPTTLLPPAHPTILWVVYNLETGHLIPDSIDRYQARAWNRASMISRDHFNGWVSTHQIPPPSHLPRYGHFTRQYLYSLGYRAYRIHPMLAIPLRDYDRVFPSQYPVYRSSIPSIDPLDGGNLLT